MGSLASVRFTTSVRTTIGYCWRAWRLKQYPAKNTGDFHCRRAAQAKAGTWNLSMICRVAVASRSSPLLSPLRRFWGDPWVVGSPDMGRESGDTGRGTVSERGGRKACGSKARRRRSQDIQWREIYLETIRTNNILAKAMDHRAFF